MKAGTYSECGPYRKRNEDYGAYAVSGDSMFLVIADGLGGMPCGQIASEMAVRESLEILKEDWPGDLTADDRREFLLRLFNEVNGKILRRCIDEPELTGMCTTLTVAVLMPDLVVTGHVGDSRGYLVREEGTVRITTDHNRAADLVAEGRISEEEALTHPGRNMLTQVVGENTFLAPYIREDSAEEGDCVVLVTDGVYSVMREDDIAKARQYEEDLMGFCKLLVTSAVKGESFDNCTAVAGVICGKHKEQ